ncbi:DUF2585 domain-containing protein [Rhizobium sp. SG2393]|uniref:DUF2585 domain-containing protein n=1 Tax=Rhizobium sp. SG2393 TaxID=3276279 RepID=UPI00366F4AAD
MTGLVPAAEGGNRKLAWLGLAALLLIAQIITLRAMGRIWICDCGFVKLFEANATGPGNSQHIADWYTFSHIIHGFIFYAATKAVWPRASAAFRLVPAVIVEMGWEILENTPLIIDRYRSATVSLDYYGDSILNSSMDTIFMAIGFLAALRLPVAFTIGLAIVFELLTGYLIRDNLTLNVIMLVWPVEAIKAWQAAL